MWKPILKAIPSAGSGRTLRIVGGAVRIRPRFCRRLQSAGQVYSRWMAGM